MHTKVVKIAHSKLVGELRYKQPSNRLIIICHGYKSSSEHPAIVGITRGLNSRGYATFTFNFPDAGGMNLEQQVADIHQVIDHFNSYDEIILCAGSFGALTAAIAAKSSRVSGLATINGFFGSYRLGHKYRATFMTAKILSIVILRYKSIWSYFKKEFEPSKISARVLVIHSMSDEVVSIVQSRNFFDKLTSPKKFVQLEKAGHHLTTDNDIDDVVAAVDFWMQ